MCFRNLPVIIQSIKKIISVDANIGKKKSFVEHYENCFVAHIKKCKNRNWFLDDVIFLLHIFSVSLSSVARAKKKMNNNTCLLLLCLTFSIHREEKSILLSFGTDCISFIQTRHINIHWICERVMLHARTFSVTKKKSELGRCVADKCVHTTYLLLNKSTDVNDLSFYLSPISCMLH